MDVLINFFHVALYQPLFNLLILLYQFLPGKDFGIAIVALTILIKLALYPLGSEAIKIQKAVQDLQPKVKELQEKYKNDKQKQATEVMDLYKQARVNPFSGLVLSLVQVPILIALWRIFWRGFQPEQLNDIYSFLPAPDFIDPMFLGILNLGEPSVALALMAGIGQFFQAKTMTPATKNTGRNKKDAQAQMSSMMQKQMLYFFPLFTVMILWKLPSALALYWIVTSLFSTFQQKSLLKNNTK